MTAFVEVDKLEKTYPGGLLGAPVNALRGISFAIQKGELMGLRSARGAP